MRTVVPHGCCLAAALAFARTADAQSFSAQCYAVVDPVRPDTPSTPAQTVWPTSIRIDLSDNRSRSEWSPPSWAVMREPVPPPPLDTVGRVYWVRDTTVEHQGAPVPRVPVVVLLPSRGVVEYLHVRGLRAQTVAETFGDWPDTLDVDLRRLPSRPPFPATPETRRMQLIRRECDR